MKTYIDSRECAISKWKTGKANTAYNSEKMGLGTKAMHWW